MKRIAALLAGLMMMAAASAYALPTYPALTLTSGDTELFIEDGSALDTEAATGVVGYNGNVGAWTLSMTTGFAPTSFIPSIHLNSMNSTNGAGNLTIKFSDILAAGWLDTGATAAVGGYLASGGSIQFTTLINGAAVSTLSGFKPGAFAAEEDFAFDSTGADLVELIAEIQHTAAGRTSFDYDVAPVPEPGTMLLLGAGFLGLAIYGKRRKNA